MIQKEKKKIKTEVGWNFCQLMKTLDFWALCREIPFWWLLPMCKFFVSYLQFWLCLCLCVCIFLVCLHKKLQCHSGVPRWWIIFNAALKRLKTPSHSTVTLSPQLLTRVYLCPNNLFSGPPCSLLAQNNVSSLRNEKHTFYSYKCFVFFLLCFICEPIGELSPLKSIVA